jgi:hypothetical protein
MALTLVREMYSVIRIGQLCIPKNELAGHVVEAFSRNSYIRSYTVKLFQEI